MIRSRCKAVQGVWKGDKGGMPGDPWVWTDSWNRFLKANDFPIKAARLHQVIYNISYLTPKPASKPVFSNLLNDCKFGIHVFLVIGGQNRGKGEAPGGRCVDPMHSPRVRLHPGRKRRRNKPHQFPRSCSKGLDRGRRQPRSSPVVPEGHPTRKVTPLLCPAWLKLSSSLYLSF